MKILYYIILAASLLALLLNRKRLDRRLLLFIPLQLFALCTELSNEVFGKGHWLYDFLFSIYTPVEYLIICVVLISFLENKRLRRIIYYSIFVFIPVSLFVQIELKPLGDFYEYLDVLVEAPLLSLWTLLFFLQFAYANNEKVLLRHAPMFWISIGNLLFFSVSAFGYGFGKYLKYKGYTDYEEALMTIIHIFNMMQYLFFLIAFTIPNWKRKYS